MKTKPQKQARIQTKAKKSNYILFRDLSRDFMEETGYTLADFSVALGGFEKTNPKIPRFWGSGVLVQKGKRFGILTAHHCVHGDYDLQFGFGGDKLVLVLKRSQFVVLPPEILIKHALGIPNGIEMEPDLAFIEILPSPQLGHIKAVSSFEVLDKNPLNIAKDFVGIEKPFVVVGFPGEYHQPPKKEGRTTRIIVKHMTYFYSIASDSIQERDGWDYIEANNVYEGNDDLPSSFAGVSGGPVWGLQISRNKADGKLVLKKYSLVGIAFLQIKIAKKQIRVRANFIKSIYDIAWRNLL